jgi:hypothetical protein
MKNRQSGASLIKIMLILSILGFIAMVAGRVVPGYYEYSILTDLADRVVGEYAVLDMQTVKKRINFELHRTHINIDDETFIVIKSDSGYRVYIDYQIDMEFSIGGKPLVLEGYEILTFKYEAES